MEQRTILYSVIYADQKAYIIIPELKDAWNLTPHRISRTGEVVELKIQNPDEIELTGFCNSDFIHIDIQEDKIVFSIDPNTTGSTRESRIYLNMLIDNKVNKLVQFALHQNG